MHPLTGPRHRPVVDDRPVVDPDNFPVAVVEPRRLRALAESGENGENGLEQLYSMRPLLWVVLQEESWGPTAQFLGAYVTP